MTQAWLEILLSFENGSTAKNTVAYINIIDIQPLMYHFFK